MQETIVWSEDVDKLPLSQAPTWMVRCVAAWTNIGSVTGLGEQEIPILRAYAVRLLKERG